MSKLIENVIQKSTVNIYYPGSDHCAGNTTCDSSTPVAKCNDCDWQFATVPCNAGCPSQPACSSIDGNTCPHLGKNVQFKFATNSSGVCLRTDDFPVVECIYDPTTFDYSDVLEYQDKFGTTTDNFNKILMPEFCFQQTTICPLIPGTDTPFDECPNILSNIDGAIEGNPGADCMNWASKNGKIADSTMINFCVSNSDPECKCTNRNNSQVYQYISSNLGSDENPACWYKPCANPQAFLVPSTINNKDCSTSVCNQVNQIIKNIPTNLTKEQLQAELNCTITSDPASTNQSTSTNNSNNTSNSSSSSLFSDSTLLLIFIIIFVIILVIILLVFVFSSSSN